MLVLALTLAVAGSIEVARTATTAARAAIAVEVGGELFFNVQGTKRPSPDWARELEIQRAQLTLKIRYGDLLRLQIEPDFGGGAVGLRDAFIEISPSEAFDVRVGRIKSPFGWLDNLGRWDLPSLSRGLVTNLFRDRLGFGDRQVAVMPRIRLRDLPGKPWIEGGVFGDLSTDLGADGAAGLGIRPLKGLDIALSWHHRAGALVGGSHGDALALAIAYDRKFLFAVIEGYLAHATLLKSSGATPTENAGLWAVRALFSVPIEIAEDWKLAPFAGASIVDPQLGAGSDLGFEVLGGVDLRAWELFRVGLEVDVQVGEARFVLTERTRLTAFVGMSI